MSDVSDFALPTDPDDLNFIKSAILDISAQNQMIKDRQDAIKDIKGALKDRVGMPNALIGKLVKAVDDEAYSTMTTENSVFELVRETVLGDADLPDDNDVDNDFDDDL